jgi:oligopeptide transport system substrate-binding protein
VLKGGQQPATSFIPPGLGGHRPATHLPAPDVAEAQRLLAAAGFPDGRGFPRLEIVTWTNVPLLEVIQQRWRHTLGLEIAIAKREARVHLAGLAAGDYDLALVPTLPDHDSALAVLDPLTADAADNYPHWHEPRFDALVDAAARTADPAARLALQQQAEALLLADLPVVPLYFNTQNYLLSPRVKGWRQDGLWNRFYLDVSLTP